MTNPKAPHTSGEETSVPVARRDDRGNELDVQLTLAVGEEDALKILGAQCRHLPWLDHYPGFPQTLRESLDSALVRGLARLKDESASAPLDDALAELSHALANFFRDHEQIDASVHMRVFVEEHAQGAGSKLLAKFAALTRNTFLQEGRGWIKNWRPFEEQVELNAGNLCQDDTDLKDKVLTIQLGEPPQIELNSKRAFLLTGVRLKVNDLAIAENTDSRIINEKSNALDLPQIPVRYFEAIKKAGGKVELVLFLGAQRREISFPVQFKLPALSEAPIALFIDMGSTTTKSARVHMSGVGISEIDLGSALRDRIDAAAKSDGALEWATFYADDTSQYLESRGIPRFNKAELANGADSALAAWVAEAIRIHAQNAAERRNAALSHVFWSFPQTGVRDFAGLNKELQRRAGAFVLDRIVILPEHECLRLRFGGVLSHLANVASVRKHEHDEAKGYKEWYDRSWWVPWRWFSKYPGPVPSLEDWQRHFAELGVDAQLREVIIIDAGGFSLDVHASVRRDGKENPFDKSFATGGTDLTKMFQKYLAKERGKELEEVTESEAERIKLRTCGDEKYDEHDYAKQLRDFTAEIYSQRLREVAAWLSENTGSKALPVILTGGGMANRFLRELVSQTLKERDLASDFITSLQLQELIVHNLPGHERDGLRLFTRVTTAFNDRVIPRIEYDILGGLIQEAQGNKEAP